MKLNSSLLCRTMTCSVCLDCFKDPVSLDCGHNFCQACITQYWEALSTNFRCPECRETFSQRNFKPNRQLGNISRKLKWELTEEREVGTVCEKHKKALDVFCQEDQTPICLVCHLSRDHKEHPVVPIEEALERPGTNRLITHFLSLTCAFPVRISSFQKQLETEKQKIVSEFQQLRQFLEEQERLRLAQLEELNQEIEKGRAEYVAKLSEEISSFSSLISEMEQKCQQPASELLQAGGCLVHSPAGAGSVTDTIRPCPRAELCPSRSDSLSTAKVTLDPDTAHPELIVSADRRSARWGETRQDLPNNPERFDTEHCVLGCEGFTSGSHYWEMEVKVEAEGMGDCAVGLAKESVSRKGEISLNPEQGIWAVSCSEDWCWAPTSPEQLIQFPPSQGPRRIRVYLDYERGQVAFFDASRGDPIFTFPPASFTGERIRPFFRADLNVRLL
uniref:Zinc finger protein RFP-like n=1 Tax=Chrysemys picta bellii TaxID=8478 RepID=A0A8C3HMU4_CHRPI